MASITRRGIAWRASVARAGVRRTATFDTRAQAERWARDAETAILADDALPDRAASGGTVKALFDRYADEMSPGKGGARWECVRLRSLPAAFPLFAGPVTALDAAALAEWRDARLLTVQPSTVNRELNLISAVLNHARKEWRSAGVGANPVHDIQRPRDPQPRTQRVPAEARTAIVKALGWDGRGQPRGAEQWIGWTFCLALETAMRRGELLGMTWEHVHLDGVRVHLPRTKNGYARDVPLSQAALALFGLLTAREGRVVPVAAGTFTTLFGRARAAAGWPTVRFHDARREATTAMAEKLGLLELSAVTGHRSVEILRRVYYQPDAAALAKKLG